MLVQRESKRVATRVAMGGGGTYTCIEDIQVHAGVGVVDCWSPRLLGEHPCDALGRQVVLEWAAGISDESCESFYI